MEAMYENSTDRHREASCPLGSRRRHSNLPRSSCPFDCQKHEVTVFSIKDPNLADRETADGVHYVHLDEDRYEDAVGEELKRAVLILYMSVIARWVPKLKKQAPNAVFILSVHNEMFAYDKVSQTEGERCIDSVAQIVTVSDYIGRTITSRFPAARSKTKTVYSGVDLKAYHPRWTKRRAAGSRRYAKRAGSSR